MILDGTKRKGGGGPKKDSKKRTSPLVANVKVPPLLVDEGGSERRLIPSPQSPYGRDPSFRRVSRELFALLLAAPHLSSQETLLPVPGFLWPGVRAGSPTTPLAEAEAQATPARADSHAVARDSPAAATQVPPSRMMAGRAAPREEFGSSGWGPTDAPALLTAEVGPRGAPASPTPNSASPLGIGRAQIPGPLPCSFELASGSSDLRPLYRCDSPSPLPPWTSVGGG